MLRTLRSAEGLIGYSLASDLVTNRYYTFSVWVDDTHLDAFVMSPHHRHAMMRLGGRLSVRRFVQWRVHGGHVPPSWPEVLDRLST
ncbi:MAG: antibiotic biosynthesis monooxygenase [Firmicutes bacterium]|nr:antibiotic biosynthesis monooxygenase [Bacillota bacterium]